MSKLKSTRRLVRQSLAVLMQEKKLLVFPVVTTFLTIFIGLFFIAPIAFQPTGHTYTEEDHWAAVVESMVQVEVSQPESVEATSGAPETLSQAKDLELNSWFVGYLTAMYLVSMFLLTFFNAAFFNEIINALNGQPVSILGGLRFAMTKLKPIAMWSLLAGIVGIIIQSLEQRLGFLGRWVVGLIGIVWSVASVFAIPVLIRGEDCVNPLEVLESSAQLIKKRWGEGLIGYLGIRAIGIGLVLLYTVFLFVVLGGLIVMFGPRVSDSTLMLALASFGAIWLLSLILIAYLQNVVNKVFQCALYVYAAEGAVPGPFDDDLLDAAWKVKK